MSMAVLPPTELSTWAKSVVGIWMKSIPRSKTAAAKPAKPAAKADFDALTNGEGRSVIVSSQLRRAVGTVAIALSDRLQRTKEPILLHSSCQEISRNFDTLSIAKRGAAPALTGASELAKAPINLDATANRGNKTLAFRGIDRLQDFASWASQRPEKVIIVGGHSLWFRSFFQLFLPPAADHISKKRKIVNCGVVGFTLQVVRDARGATLYRIDPASIAVVYGGFDTKGK